MRGGQALFKDGVVCVWKLQVHIQRLGVVALNRARGAVGLARNHAHQHALIGGDLWHLVTLNISVPRFAEFVLSRQVQPQLKPFHHAFFLFRHFAVDQAAACGHPLHAAVLQQAFMAAAVFVAHATRNHVSHGFKPAVWVVGEACDVVARLVAAKGIEHQEGV